MSKKITTFLFYGSGSEYVLNSLYKECVSMGLVCVEIDALAQGDSRNQIQALIGTPVVFVTSAHLLMTEKNFNIFYETHKKFYGPLEIIELVKPLKSFFIPHDLTQPLIHFEEMFINQFDYFLTPCEPFTTIYSQYVDTVEVGWIKYRLKKSENQTKKMALKKIKHKAIWFLSDFVVHINMGMKESFKKIGSILKQGVSIKFPLWEGSDEFEKYFSEKGIHVFPAKENSIDLILQHDIILTNGLSSIVAESYLLGKTTINIVEGSHYGNEKNTAFAYFPDVQFVQNIIDFKLPKISVQKRSSALKPFDNKKVMELLTQT